jgi:hypothetical protein
MHVLTISKHLKLNAVSLDKNCSATPVNAQSGLNVSPDTEQAVPNSHHVTEDGMKHAVMFTIVSGGQADTDIWHVY